MMKYFKSGLMVGLSIFIVSGIVLTPVSAGIGFLSMHTPEGAWHGAAIGAIIAVALGIAAGFVVGLGMHFMSSQVEKAFAPLRQEFKAQNRLVMDDSANHVNGNEIAGGWLFLLKDSLYFVAHNNNMNVHEVDIPLATIAGAEVVPFGSKSSALQVTRKDGSVEIYVINQPEDWVVAIAETKE